MKYDPTQLDPQTAAPLVIERALQYGSRAARKDFYDLYSICQNIPLRRILDLAPTKYPSTRDFESQTVKRLVYFETAEQDVDPQLLSPVSWQEVKEYFIKQSKQIADTWLT